MHATWYTCFVSLTRIFHEQPGRDRFFKIMLMLNAGKASIHIVSGGQTGVDRAALDAALEQDVPVGGWCPEGRLAEDGVIPERYPLRELPGGGYAERTKQNVIDSNGTVIFYFATLFGGTRLTREFCLSEAKPHLLIDALAIAEDKAVQQLAACIESHEIQVLNVAGPRASNEPEAYPYAFRVITAVLRTYT